jgi:hypothetical protein
LLTVGDGRKLAASVRGVAAGSAAKTGELAEGTMYSLAEQ